MEQSSSAFTVKGSGSTRELFFNHPPKNVLSLHCLEQLELVYKELTKDKSICLVVLRSGIEDVFSFGLDPKELLERDLEGRKNIFRQLATTMIAIIDSGIPTICDISGPALAGGAVLAFMGDVVFGKKDHVRISFSETKIGLCAPEFVWKQVAHHVPVRFHTEVVALGRNIDTKTAAEMSTLNGIYDNAEKRAELIEFYSVRFARLDVDAVRKTIREGKHVLRRSLEEMQSNPEALGQFLSSPTVEKGLKSIL